MNVKKKDGNTVLPNAFRRRGCATDGRIAMMDRMRRNALVLRINCNAAGAKKEELAMETSTTISINAYQRLNMAMERIELLTKGSTRSIRIAFREETKKIGKYFKVKKFYLLSPSRSIY